MCPKLSEINFLIFYKLITIPPIDPPKNPIIKSAPIFSIYVAPAAFVIAPIIKPNVAYLIPTFPLLINTETIYIAVALANIENQRFAGPAFFR